MKKKLKISVSVIFVIMFLYGTIFFIDYSRCKHFKEPIFVVSGIMADDGGSGIYYGLGYKVKVEKAISAKYGATLIKVEMYMFDKIIVGAIADASDFNDNEYETLEGQYQFAATIVEIYDNSIIVEPDENSKERKSSDKISMSISKVTNESDTFSVGKKIKITYNGVIMESYPAQIIATKIEPLK